MLLSISHTSRYDFSEPVARGLQRLRQHPKSSHGQQVLDWTMELDGAVIEAEFDDHNNNHTTLVSLVEGTTSVSVTCSGTVQTADTVGIVGPHSGYTPLWCFLAQTPLTLPGARIKALAASLAGSVTGPLTGPGPDVLGLMHDLSAAVYEAVRYEVGATDAGTTAEEAVVAGHGVCQDHAHVFVGAARLLGVPARYISGYLLMPDRPEQEAGHAWAEAHVPGLGWVGFDVSNRVSPDTRYVRVASGLDYRDAAPISGMTFGATSETGLFVRLSVEQQPAAQ